MLLISVILQKETVLLGGAAADLVGNEQLSRAYLYGVLDEELASTGDVDSAKGRACIFKCVRSTGFSWS